MYAKSKKELMLICLVNVAFGGHTFLIVQIQNT